MGFKKPKFIVRKKKKADELHKGDLQITSYSTKEWEELSEEGFFHKKSKFKSWYPNNKRKSVTPSNGFFPNTDTSELQSIQQVARYNRGVIPEYARGPSIPQGLLPRHAQTSVENYADIIIESGKNKGIPKDQLIIDGLKSIRNRSNFQTTLVDIRNWANTYLQGAPHIRSLDPVDIDTLDPKKRAKYLYSLTSPDMKGFFPKYSTGFHSKVITGEDTETDDRSKIIEYAGLKLVYNFTKKRFEQLKDPSDSERLLHFTSPTNELTRTEGIHGYTQKILAAISRTPSDTWGPKYQKEISNWATEGGAIEMGHNLLHADMAWMAGHKSGGLRPESIKTAFLDTLFLSEAIFGKAKVNPYTKESDGRNKLQNLAKKFGVSAEDLGLKAHKGYNDVIVTFKVLEELLRRYPQHPAVKEYLAGMRFGKVQSKRWSAPSNGFGMRFKGEGFVLTGLRGGAMDEELMDFIAAETGQGEPGIPTGVSASDLPHTEDGSLDGMNIEDELSDKELFEMQSEWRKPHRQYIEDMEFPQQTGASIGLSGREFALKTARDLYKAGVSDDMVDSLVSKLASGADVILDRGMKEAILSSAKMISGRKSLYDKWEEIQRIKNSRALADFNDIRNAHIRMGRKAREVIGFHAGIVNQYKHKYKSRPGEFLYGNARVVPTTGKGFYADSAAQRQAARAARSSETLIPRYRDIAKNMEAYSKEKYKSNDSFDEWLAEHEKWGTSENPEHSAKWDRDSEFAIAEEQRQSHNAFGAWVEEGMNKKEAFRRALGTGYIFPNSKYKDMASSVAYSQDAYTEALEKTIKTNEIATKGLKAMYKAGQPFFNWARLDMARLQGAGMIGHAASGLLPGFLRTAGNRFTSAITETMQGDLAWSQYGYSTASNVGSTLMAGGGALAMVPGGQLAGGIVAGIGAVTNLVSNILGGYEEAEIKEATSKFSAKINLLSTGVEMLLAPLKLLRSGLGLTLDIFSRLGRIWGTQYGIPLTHLTGINSGMYSTMMAADNFFGLKQGTTNASHEQFAMGQASLYSSGQFDQKRLVAAARLGVFDTVYAPMGGNSASQYATTINRLSAQMATNSDAANQQLLYLASQVDPNMPNILERLHLFNKELGKSIKYEDYQTGRAFSNVFLRPMTKHENAVWEWTAGEYHTSMMSMDFGLKRLATPIWEKVGRPLVNVFNDALDMLGNEFNNPNAQGTLFDRMKPAAEHFWKGLMRTFGFDEDTTVGELWESAKTNIKESFAEGLGSIIIDGLKTAFGWIAEQESGLLETLVKPFSKAIDYLEAMNIQLDWNLSDGFHIKVDGPDKAANVMREDFFGKKPKKQDISKIFATEPWVLETYRNNIYNWLEYAGINKDSISQTEADKLIEAGYIPNMRMLDSLHDKNVNMAVARIMTNKTLDSLGIDYSTMATTTATNIMGAVDSALKTPTGLLDYAFQREQKVGTLDTTITVKAEPGTSATVSDAMSKSPQNGPFSVGKPKIIQEK